MRDPRNRFRTGSVYSLLAACLLALAGGAWGLGNTYYISTTGNDLNDGSLGNPFGTFEHAISTVGQGDTIYVRGGTYAVNHDINLNKSGTALNPINMFAMPGETPILDFLTNPRHANPPQPRTDDSIAATSDAYGIFVAPGSDYWHLKGLTVANAPYYGVRVYSSHNTFEQLTIHGSEAAGLEICSKEGNTPSYNLVLNSDSYQNYDPQTHGEDADGFGVKFDTNGVSGTGNVFRGLRSWGNSDDGYDFWHDKGGVTLENSWSFSNGFNIFGGSSFAGDGNGFKLGEASGPHTLQNCLAWSSKADGFQINSNSNAQGVRVYNSTAYSNGGVNYRFDNGSYPDVLKNDISYNGSKADVLTGTGLIQATNSWTSGIGGVNAADFASLVDSIARGPRNADGSLPSISDFRLVAGSNLIDVGTDVGLPYYGSKPDIGAFEYVPPVVGDLTSDGYVDDFDLNILLSHWGQAATAAQGNLVTSGGSTNVDDFDLNILLTNWTGAPGPSPQPVPEPALAAPLLLAFFAVRRARRAERGIMV